MFGAPSAKAPLSPLASWAEDCWVMEQTFPCSQPWGPGPPGSARVGSPKPPNFPHALLGRGTEAGLEPDMYFIESSQIQDSEQGHSLGSWGRGRQSESPDAGSPLTLGSSHRSPSCWVSGQRGPRSWGRAQEGREGSQWKPGCSSTRRRPQTPETGRGRGSGGREGGPARSSRPPYCMELLAASLPGSQLQGGSRAHAPLCPNHTASHVVSVVKTNMSQCFVSTAGGARWGLSSR